MRWMTCAAGALLLSLGLAASAVAEVEKVLISYQPGLTCMPVILAGTNKLIQKHAAAAGVGNLAVDWILLASGGAAMEALISGNIDVVTAGAGNLLAAWDRTQGEVKGLAACFGKNDAWNIYMICDPDHMANYSADGSTPIALHQAGTDRQLVFESKGLVSKLPTPGLG